MKYLCFGMISVGALIMAFSIFAYYKTLQYMRGQTYDKTVFKQWIYGASFMMMVFFLVGYICVGAIVITSPYQSHLLLISVIFFFGSIFVLCMVNVQKMMAETITGKTIETMQSMVRSMEAKDVYTKGHSEHVRDLCELIYTHLPQETKMKVDLASLKDAALLHDIGKIGIPDKILNKPGKLTEEEFEVIKTHPENGKGILESTCYREIGPWVLYHHERMDGNGYYKMPGRAIPLESKIICMADIFSALYTDRVYRKKFTYEDAIDIIKSETGTVLDPFVVEIFCNISKEEVDSKSIL